MRTLMRVSIPVEAGNEAIRSGSLAEILGSTMEAIRPEAVYCITEHGQRTALVVFDLDDPAKIPVVAEPFFMALNAQIELTPCMTLDDVQRGIGQLPRARTAEADKVRA